MKFVLAFYDRRGFTFANHLDGSADAVDFGIRRNERRHRIDVIAKRSEPHAGFANHAQNVVCGRFRLQFQDSDSAENTHVRRIFKRTGAAPDSV